MSYELYPPNPAFRIYFITFHFVGGIGNLLLLIVVGLSRKTVRHPTWYAYCFSWVPYTAAYLLLILTGHQFEPTPPPGICLVQAVFVYAGTTLSGTAMFSFVVHLWLHRRAILSDSASKESFLQTFVLLVLPYVVSFAVLVVALVVGAEHPSSVHRNFTRMYCITDNKLPERVVSAISVVVMPIIVFLEVSIAVVLYRHWTQFWGFHSRTLRAFLAITIRIGIFSVFCGMSAIVCFIVIMKHETPIPSTFLALLPVVSFLLMGTQVDIIRTCMFWRKPDPATQPPCDVQTV